MAFLRVPGGPANAQSIQHLTITQPGGMPGLPVMTGVTRLTNGLSVTWDGPGRGYYQLFQKHSLKDASWQAVGAATNLARQATITALSSNAFFRVSGPSPVYAGSNACAECHGSILSTEIKHAASRKRSKPCSRSARPPTPPAWPATRWVTDCRPDSAARRPPRSSRACNARIVTARRPTTRPMNSTRPCGRGSNWRPRSAAAAIPGPQHADLRRVGHQRSLRR